METRDIIGIIAILAGPVTAVCITLWWQQRKEKRDAKLRLFGTLMAHRKAMPLAPEWVMALNLIDVVFSDHPKVLALWHELYQLFQNPTRTQAQDHKYLELLSEMASVLRFRQLQQTDIDKFYLPQTHLNQLIASMETQTEWLRVLKNTERFVVEKKKDDPSSS